MPSSSSVQEPPESPSSGNDGNSSVHEVPKDLVKAQEIIDELRLKCRVQAEQILAWKKAYSIQNDQHYREQKAKTDQLNYLTSQLLLIESKLIKKQKQIANLLNQRELTIFRQQRIIESLSSRLVDHGILDPNSLDVTTTDFDSLNDSDSAVVLEDIDSDTCSGSIGLMKRRANDVTIVRSISDAIETNLKYGNTRRSNCFLRRPDILETVYSVEEDSEQLQGEKSAELAEKRDKFKNRTLHRVETECSDDNELAHDDNVTSTGVVIVERNCVSEQNTPVKEKYSNSSKMQPAPTVCYNRVMSNHRAVTKVKDVKYKRINKAKSKSLEELRGRLRHWVERGVSSLNSQDHHHHPAPPQIAAQTYA
uniref:CSON007222 protein n=1 Tax=Culicoides sonorensis TaxID=179676 RepID=A0A336LXK1_CULSO